MSIEVFLLCQTDDFDKQEVNQDLVIPPFIMKRRWQDMFQHVVEEWTNTTLEPTDIYGIRTYYDGLV